MHALLIVLLLLPMAWTAPLAAQQQAVGGRVVTASTREPLSDAQIQVLGTERGVYSQTNGRFLILNLPGETVTLRVTLIGYKTLEQTVRVGTMNLELLMDGTAVELDALVVTGTPGAQQVRALGNAVGKVEPAALQEIATPTTVRDIIGARIPGVSISHGEGTVGSGGATAIRGVGSLSLSHEPLVYVDGVRVDNNPNQTGTGSNYNGGTARINDFDPEDIESIEVIKGPAATTLYGTEASNGVIQIITKRGRTQAAQWDFHVDQGATYLPSPEKIYPDVWARQNDQLISMNIVANEAALGHPVFTTGHNQAYGASVRGGTDDVRYYLSGDWNREEGVVTYNWQNKLNLRSNLSFVLGDQLDIQFNLATMRLRTRASGYQPITTMIIWGTPLLKDARTRGFLINAPEDYNQITAIEQYDRTVSSVQLNHHPLPWLDQRLTVGGDFGFRRGSQLIDRTPEQPGPFGAASRGEKDLSDTRTTFETVDYTATAGLDVTSGLRSETSVGGTFIRRLRESSSASGEIFPVPGLETVSATSTRSAGEGYVEERSVGAFVQEQFAYKNRYFLTAGVRGDDHSAFGKNFDFVVYPKVMGSWVASEEPFLRGLGFLNALKLRAAWGKAGQQPSTFAAVRLYSPSTGNDATPTVTPSNIGNPDLEPEVGQEIELGFDASLLDDRLGVEFTYYDQSTKQALISAPVQPSTGFPGSQSLNLGEISNKGIELGLHSTPIRREKLAWNLDFTLATNTNEIVSLGGITIPPAATGNEQVEGFPISGMFFRKVVSAEYDANGQLVNVMCDGGTGPSGKAQGGAPVPCSQAPTVFWGGPLPRWQGSLASTLTLFGDLRLYALVDYQGGNWRTNADIGASHVFFTNSKCINERPICSPELAAYAAMGQYQPAGTMKAGFAKLRTVSASYTLPDVLVGRMGASRATLTVAADNLLRLWTAEYSKYGHHLTDPEIGKEGTALDSYEQEAWPQFTRITTSLRISF
ncbi:MAG: SusC/RagA family TonB-linked outer membrane protein [Gemmatimonadetes bacterium]|nr:SusC/RagA family TonB-linked outer membrane protein [Gemmatimonadota bacterium]